MWEYLQKYAFDAGIITTLFVPLTWFFVRWARSMATKAQTELQKTHENLTARLGERLDKRDHELQTARLEHIADLRDVVKNNTEASKEVAAASREQMLVSQQLTQILLTKPCLLQLNIQTGEHKG